MGLLVHKTLLLEDIVGCLPLLRVMWIKANLSNHEIVLQLGVLLESDAELMNVLRCERLDAEMLTIIQVAPLELAVRNQLFLTDCRLEVQVSSHHMARNERLIIDFESSDARVVAVPGGHTCRHEDVVVEGVIILGRGVNIHDVPLRVVTHAREVVVAAHLYNYLVLVVFNDVKVDSVGVGVPHGVAVVPRTAVDVLDDHEFAILFSFTELLLQPEHLLDARS